MRDEVTINCAVDRLQARLQEIEAEDRKYSALWKVYSQRLYALQWVLKMKERILLPLTVEDLLKGLD